jgi:hypothetical protein
MTRLLLRELVRQRFGTRNGPSEPRADSLVRMIHDLRRPGEGFQEMFDRLVVERRERVIRRDPEIGQPGYDDDRELVERDSGDDGSMIVDRDDGLVEHMEEDQENMEEEDSDQEDEDGEDEDVPPLVPEAKKYSPNEAEDLIETFKTQLLTFTHGAILVLTDPFHPSKNPQNIITRRIKPSCSLHYHHYNDHFPFLQVRPQKA